MDYSHDDPLCFDWAAIKTASKTIEFLEEQGFSRNDSTDMFELCLSELAIYVYPYCKDKLMLIIYCNFTGRSKTLIHPTELKRQVKKALAKSEKIVKTFNAPAKKGFLGLW